MNDAAKQFRVSGFIRSDADAPVEGVIVQAFDKDFFRDQALGAAITDRAGRYEIAFNRDAFTGPLLRLERAPDIFLHVLDRAGGELASTAASVVVDAGQDTRIDVTVKGVLVPPSRISYIHGEPVDLVAAAKLTGDELVHAYRYLRKRAAAPERLELLRTALPSYFIGRASNNGGCGEGRYDTLRFLAREKGRFDLDQDTDADNFPAGVPTKTFFTARIAVVYTTDSAADPVNFVDGTLPAADATLTLSDGTTVIGTVRANLADLDPANTEVAPAYIQRIGLVAENALSQFIAAPYNFRDPRNGAARLEYRVLEQGAGFYGGTNQAWTHVEVDPGNTTEILLHTVPHEMFHQIQYRYNSTASSSSGIYSTLREGGARFIEDSMDDASNRYAREAPSWFGDMTQTLLNGAATGSVSYRASLMWKYIAEQHSTHATPADNPATGVDSYRLVLEQTGTAAGLPGLGYTIPALRNARAQMPYYGQFDQFLWYSAAANELSTNETTWGNFLVTNYLHGTAAPTADHRFDYGEDTDPILWTGSPIATLAAAQATVTAANNLVITAGANITRNVAGQSPFAATYFRATPSGATGMLRITFTAAAGLTDPLVQILRLGAASALVDLHRSDATTWSKTINLSGLTSVVVIAATRETGGNYSVQFEEIASASDVMVTRWNSAGGTEYEQDPSGWSWTWISPDVMVDTNNDSLRDPDVFFDQNNTLKVRLRNRGNAVANGVQVQFWYQKAAGGLNPASWIPVTDELGAVQTAGPLTLNPGDELWVPVNWAPANDGSSAPHWCVKAQITAPGDANGDNKVVLSNFGHVIVSADGDTTLSQLIRATTDAVLNRIFVIPRGPRWKFLPKGDPIGDPLVRQAAVAAHDPRRFIGDRTTFQAYALQRTKLEPWDKRRTAAPQDSTYYPVVAESSLPPGTVAENLITIAHVADGRVVGGVTYEVVG